MDTNTQIKVLGVILARGGSKSIPKKSIALCAGQPLMHYTIQAAKNAKTINRLVITTDSQEMADFAKQNGVEVPFIRPENLAEDTTPDLPVFQHLLAELKEKENYAPDIIVQLRPTTPLKKSADIDKAVRLLIEHPQAQSVRSVSEPDHTPFKMYTLDEPSGLLKPLLANAFPEVFAKYPEAYNMPRQILPQTWRHVGYIDVFRTEVVTDLNSMSGTRILPLFFDKWREADIDSPAELAQAEEIILKLRQSRQETWE
jgi:CMP-N-acetylneuraminic acid synthetase